MSVKSIAAIAGCCPATVSRVLRDADYHCKEPGLEDRIRAAAIDTGYAPNEAARNLRLGVTQGRERPLSLNVLMTRTERSQADPFFLELLRIVESEIHKSSHILSQIYFQPVFSDEARCDRSDRQALVDELIGSAQTVDDGLIIIGKCDRRIIRLLKKRYRGIVSINRNSTNYEVDEVICDGAKIASIAVSHLIRLGHRHIGYVGACHNEARYAGYLDTLQSNGIQPVPSDCVEVSQHTELAGVEAMEELMSREEMPTGIYFANDILAIGALKAMARKRGMFYHPSIIASDDIEEAQFTTPMLSTVRLPRDEMGKLALYLLTDRLRGGHEAVVRTEFEGRLVDRSSCAPMEYGV